MIRRRARAKPPGRDVIGDTEGADTAVWLATLDDGGPTGGFFRDGKMIAAIRG